MLGWPSGIRGTGPAGSTCLAPPFPPNPPPPFAGASCPVRETGAITKIAATAAAAARANIELQTALFLVMGSLPSLSDVLVAPEPDCIVLEIRMALIFEQRRILVRVAVQIHANRPRTRERLRIRHGRFIPHYVRA